MCNGMNDNDNDNQFLYIPTNKNLADIISKALPSTARSFIISKISNQTVSFTSEDSSLPKELSKEPSLKKTKSCTKVTFLGIVIVHHIAEECSRLAATAIQSTSSPTKVIIFLNC